MLLSIIVPVYNVQNYIGKTLQTLFDQTSKDFELIIVNDGSTDNSLQVINERLKTVDNINIVLFNKTNSGVSAARNAGISLAKGDYIFFLDGDDYVSPHLVDEIYRRIENSSPDIICWNYKTVIDDNYTESNSNACHDEIMTGIQMLNRVIIKKQWSLWTGSIAYKKNMIIDNQIWFHEGCVAGEDSEFIYKSLSQAKMVVHIDKIYSYYLQRHGSIMNTYNIRRFDSIEALERTSDYLLNVNDKLSRVANNIKMNDIVKNYIGTYRLCLVEAIAQYNDNKYAVNILNRDIETNYPDLMAKVRKYSTFSADRPFALTMQILLFKASPILHYKVRDIITKITQ